MKIGHHLPIAFIAVTAACTSEPEYPVERLAFEPRLLGRWEAVAPPGEEDWDERMEMVIEPRNIAVRDGRAGASGFFFYQPRETTTVYKIHICVESDEPTDLNLFAYPVQFDETLALGVQITADQLDLAGGAFFALPLHRFFPIRLDGDTLTIGAPVSVAWVPGAGWLDGRSDQPTDPGAALRREEQGTLLLTSSIDRLLAEHDAAPGALRILDGESATFRRMPD